VGNTEEKRERCPLRGGTEGSATQRRRGRALHPAKNGKVWRVQTRDPREGEGRDFFSKTRGIDSEISQVGAKKGAPLIVTGEEKTHLRENVEYWGKKHLC